jgi:uncharacterized membrane protein
MNRGTYWIIAVVGVAIAGAGLAMRSGHPAIGLIAIIAGVLVLVGDEAWHFRAAGHRRPDPGD